MTVFLRTRAKIDAFHANTFMGSLFYAIIRLVTNGIPELSMTLARLPVFYKQRDFYFYPAWAYSIPAAILKIPFSFIDAFIWTALTYYVIGYSPEPERFDFILKHLAYVKKNISFFSSTDVMVSYRFLRHLLVLFFLHQVSVSLFRLIASLFQNQAVANFSGFFTILMMFLFCGFIVPRREATNDFT